MTSWLFDFFFWIKVLIVVTTVVTLLLVAKLKLARDIIWPVMIVGTHILIFFVASLARSIWGVEWWLKYFSMGFTNNWSLLLYAHISLTALTIAYAYYVVERLYEP